MNSQLRSLLILVLAALLSLATSFSWIMVSGYCGFDYGVLSAFLISGSFSLAGRITGKMAAWKMAANSVVIGLSWIVDRFL